MASLLNHLRWILLSAFVGAVVFDGSVGGAQPRANDAEYSAQGRLLVLRVVPVDRTAKVFFAGRKALQIDLKKENKVLEIFALGPAQKKEVLQFTGDGEAVEITQLPDWKQPYELFVKSQTRGEIEEVKIRLKTPVKP